MILILFLFCSMLSIVIVIPLNIVLQQLFSAKFSILNGDPFLITSFAFNPSNSIIDLE